ncbi:MAG: alpha-L-fucosidase [Chitinophagaceae bacterium]
MKILFAIISTLLFSMTSVAQPAPKPFGALPSDRQLKWHETEVYGLIHFTPTTFENKEWGYGDADPKIFNPTQFDAEKIVTALKAGGLKGVILVAKHHDGFALWPTQTTNYNITASPFRNGKGDLVKEVEQACRKHGLKFGVYCSPWDRNNPVYGTPAYVDAYRTQLKELYTNYGELFMSWHDGANGGDGYYGGARTTKKIDRATYYGWDTTWAITRKMQPNANIFSDIGWDVRWVGNERGFAAETSWATFTPVPAEGESKTVPGQLDDKQNPFGTRNGNNWVPAECDVPLRKGWFYHPEEKDKVKSPAQLFDLYLKSVGRGGALDLGIAPDTRGLLAEEDVRSLEGFGKILNASFKKNMAKLATITSKQTRGKAFSTKNLVDDNTKSYWASKDDDHLPEIVFDWKEEVEFDLIRLREFIPLGQRIESVEIASFENGAWKKIATATSIGAARIILLDSPVKSKKVKINIVSSPVCVTFSEIGFYKKSEF